MYFYSVSCHRRSFFHSCPQTVLEAKIVIRYSSLTDINECQQDLCGPNTDCENTIGRFFCRCKEGFYLNDLEMCEGNLMKKMHAFQCSALFAFIYLQYVPLLCKYVCVYVCKQFIWPYVTRTFY